MTRHEGGSDPGALVDSRARATLRKLGSLGVVACLALALGACGREAGQEGEHDAAAGPLPAAVAGSDAAATGPTRPDGLFAELVRPERPAPALSLTDQNGQPWSMEQARGKVVLLFFGYTHCPDYCPQTLGQVRQALQDLGAAAAGVQVVMVSADPERDRPEVLAAYLADHLPGAVGLTGEMAALEQAAAAFGAEFHKDPLRQAGGAPGGSGAYTVSHTGRLYLIDPHGQLRGSYLGALSPAELGADLERLLPGDA